MTDHHTKTRQLYLERIQARTTVRDLLLVAACGAFLGWLCAQFI
jgi:hypothetical protein